MKFHTCVEKGKGRVQKGKQRKAMCYPTGHHCASNYRTSAVTWLNTMGHHQTGTWEKTSENSPSKKKKKKIYCSTALSCWSKYILCRNSCCPQRFFFLVPFPLCRLLPKSHPCPKVIGSSIPRNDHKCKKVKKCGKSDFQRAVTRGELPSFLAK